MSVTTQPSKFQPSNFHNELFDCCDDCGVCWYTLLCPLCVGCSIASDMDECYLCGLGMPIRSVYRTRYNIKGSMCEDFLVGTFCCFCATCQLKMDIEYKKKNNTF